MKPFLTIKIYPVIMKTKVARFAVLLSTVMLSFLSCKKKDGAGDVYPRNVTIEYRYAVSSGTPNLVEISYTNESGGTDNLSNVNLPYTKTISCMVNRHDDVSTLFSAFGPGGIKGEIYVDGKLVGSKMASSNNASSSFNDVISYSWK
jgi:hypothetical protein